MIKNKKKTRPAGRRHETSSGPCARRPDRRQ
jgi:hypothetical protein